MTTTNPFFTVSSLPYHVPDFQKIHLEHYEPAFEKGFEEQRKEIDAIVSNPEAPSFENTVEKFENSGELLHRVSQVFFNLCSANTSKELKEIQSKFSPKLTAHRDSIYLNSALFHRLQAVEEKEGAQLSNEKKRLLEVLKQDFLLSGTHLDEKEKEELKKINERLATLSTDFGNALLDARDKGSLLVTNVEELEGLSEDAISTAQAEATKLGHPPGTYLLLLINTVQQPMMQQLKNRETRRRLLEASLKRATGESGPDGVNTIPLLEETVRLRLKKAKLMGKQTFTEWKLQDQMAYQESAQNLLKEVSGHAIVKAEEEAAEIRAYMKEAGISHELEPWDWCYYQELVRKKKFLLNDEEVKPYMELYTVLEKGAFFVASELYGLQFEKRAGLPTYDADVACYEVFDAVGDKDRPLALFFFDPYARDSKRGGAWMTQMVSQKGEQRPVVYNVLNVVKPPPGEPTLLTLTNLTTLFHEFGHALHGILSMQTYTTLAGTNVPRDFVEFPSQINEKWSLQDKVLRHYAFHYATKEPIPDELVKKLQASEKFGVGFHSTELMKASVIDLEWHMATDEKQLLPMREMEAATLKKYGLEFPLIPPRYTSTLFQHIFGGGYASGYYAYTWAKVLDCDGFEYFLQHGGLTAENGTRFRNTVLSVGNSVDPNESFRNFTEHDPSIGAYLRLTGLKA